MDREEEGEGRRRRRKEGRNRGVAARTEGTRPLIGT